METSGPQTFIGPVVFQGAVRQLRWAELPVFDWTTACSTGDGKYYFVVPKGMGGYLADISGHVIAAGTTGTMSIQIHNVTKGVDLLTTLLTLDSGEGGSQTAAAKAEIDQANNRVDEYDVLRVDVDAVHTTPAQGLIVLLGLR